jgi:hypothetical protein
MKRLVSLILVVTLVLTFAGCYTVNIKAPEGKKILISSKEVVVPDMSKKAFYLLWGLVPITDNSTADLLSKYPDGAEVAISTKFDILDYLISYVLGQVSFGSKTIEVEKK